MGLFGDGAASPRRLRRQADQHGDKAVGLLESGRSVRAYEHSEQAIAAVAALRAAEPDQPEHVMRLAARLHHHAAILEDLGHVSEALAASRDAVRLYRTVEGGDLGPADVAYLAGLATMGTTAAAVRPLEVAIQAAEAKGRLALLLAKCEGARAAHEVRRIGGEALDVYERLAVRDGRYRADLSRITEEYTAARRLVGD